MTINGHCNQLLARVNFPPYAVKMLSARYLLVAGGGGKAKSGIANVLEIYELSYDGLKCCARPASRFHIGDSACMNCVAWWTGNCYAIAAGLDGKCQLYKVKSHVVSMNSDGINPNLKGRPIKRRHGNFHDDQHKCSQEKTLKDENQSTPKDNPDHNDNNVKATVQFHLETGPCFQTDFPVKDDEPYQKVVRISPDLKFLVTGGSDGHLRIWQFPGLALSLSIHAHNDDVDDLDIHPLGDKIASVSRDGHAYVWALERGDKIAELKWDSRSVQKYRCRNCRFGVLEGSKYKSNLFTVHVPFVKTKSGAPCYLVKWNTTNYIPQNTQSVRGDLSSLAVSDDGRYVATGTMSGTVAIYISFSLQRLYCVPGSHSNFITGLQFLPSTEETNYIVGIQDASLVSISVDNQIKIHHIPRRDTIGIGAFMLLLSSLLISTFFLMSYLDI